MKKTLPVCLALLTGVGACLGEPRTFTSKKGKMITAELIRVEEQDAVLKLANAKRVKVPVASLSDADQEFVKSWWEENKNNATESDVRFTITKKAEQVVATKRRNGRKSTVDSFHYACELTSYTPKDLSDITVDYTIYKRTSTRSRKSSDTRVSSTNASHTIRSLPAHQKVTFETKSVTCEDWDQQAYGNIRPASQRETVIGIVLSFSVNGEEFMQKSHPDGFLERADDL